MDRRTWLKTACAAGIFSLVTAGCSTRPDASSGGDPVTYVSNDGLQSTPIVPTSYLQHNPVAGRRLHVLAGWNVEAWLNITDASMMDHTPDGDLLVSSPAEGKIYRVHQGRGASEAPSVSEFLAGLDHPYSIQVAKVGRQNFLFVGELGQISRYTLSGSRAANRLVIASGLPKSGLHPYPKIKIGPKSQWLYFSIGSSADSEDVDPVTGEPRGVINRVGVSGGKISPFAQGMRYAAGLDFAPDNTLYAAISGVSDASYPYHSHLDGKADAYGMKDTSWAASQPVTVITRIYQDENLGWPYCMPDSSLKNSSGLISYVADPDRNSRNRIIKCSDIRPSETAIPAHSNPSSLVFLFDTKISNSLVSGAIVVAGGATDFSLPSSGLNSAGSPGLYYLTWDSAKKTLKNPSPMVSGFVSDDGEIWGRPADACVGIDGKLYVTDRVNGLIYRLTPPAS